MLLRVRQGLGKFPPELRAVFATSKVVRYGGDDADEEL